MVGRSFFKMPTICRTLRRKEHLKSSNTRRKFYSRSCDNI
jgi:hypothetical protein